MAAEKAQQKLKSEPGNLIAEKSIANNPGDNSDTVYLQLSAAAQWLRFPPDVEKEFITDYYNSTVKTTRWAFTAGFMIYALFGWLDMYVAPVSLQQVWLIRFGIGCPVLLLVVLFTYVRKFAGYMQLMSSAAAIIGGVGLVFIIGITRPEEVAYSHYYSGLILVMLFTSSWLRLRFWYALVTNTIIVICYELAAIYWQNLLATQQGNILFLSNNFLLLGTYVIGAFANYSLERHTRMEFLQQRIIEAEKNKVTAQRVAIEQQAHKLSKALSSLKETQSRLINSEKLASLGELTAGIAHEIKNPLNFVTNFSEVSIELINEFEAEATADNKEQTIALAANLKEILQKIAYHGNRADSIVKNMLQHSRKESGEREPADINVLVDEYFRLSYQGLRARDKTFNTTMQLDLDKSIGNINIVSQDIGRVLLNLFTNAFYSVNQKKKQSGSAYEPVVTVSTKITNGFVIIKVKDNGLGITQKAMGKIFQPFFTTKPSGEGVGLGLSLSHEIITKSHGGTLTVESVAGEFAEFIIQLPVNV
jgi:signal transduction histidine kinase